MIKTLRLSFSLRNTYRVNSILYSLKQIPLIKKLLPDMLYRVWGLKVFANVLSVLWELISIFLGKFLYFLLMIAGAGLLYEGMPKDALYLHILLFLTIIGAFANTSLFNPTRDKYYAMILMRMDSREYTLVNYGYSILKIIVGFLPFTLLFGRMAGLSVYVCLLLPLSVAGLKLTAAAISLWDYERRGVAYNENQLSKYAWLAMGLLLAASYGLPAVGVVLPKEAAAVVMLLFIPAGALGIRKIITFGSYREVNQQLLSRITSQMDNGAQISQKQSQKAISTDVSITSRRKGFEYLNELFIRRHQKILWKASKKVAAISSFLILGCLLALYIRPEMKERVNELMLTFLPYFVFIMYAINRGTEFTKALFMNCDHSLLTYSFYKQPAMVLKLFRIRLREIIKINLLPAAVIGAGLALILFVSGGTDYPLNYGVIFISILAMSMFFSVHYLTIYYLLQPYNGGTEMKSGMYPVILSATYLVCFFMMRLKMDTLIFGILCIVFCVLYCILACFLIYRLAPKTFRLRS
ncbi:MAG: hypothetical protein ACOX8H_04950 [Ruminococcus sp.]|jgi:hypothetical protein